MPFGFFIYICMYLLYKLYNEKEDFNRNSCFVYCYIGIYIHITNSRAR